MNRQNNGPERKLTKPNIKLEKPKDLLSKQLKMWREWVKKNTKMPNSMPKIQLEKQKILMNRVSKRPKTNTRTLKAWLRTGIRTWKIWLRMDMIMWRIKLIDRREKSNVRPKMLKTKPQVIWSRLNKEWSKNREKRPFYSQQKNW